MELHVINVIYLDVCRCIFWGSSLVSVVIVLWICVKVDKGKPWGIRNYWRQIKPLWCMTMHSDFHCLRHDPHSRIADKLYQNPAWWEVWQCLKLCLGVCRVVYSFSRSWNHRERERMVVRSSKFYYQSIGCQETLLL